MVILVRSEMSKIKNATQTQSPEGSQRNDDQMFKTGDSCAFVTFRRGSNLILFLQLILTTRAYSVLNWTQICKFYFCN